mgnify:CR=1 FL=1
MASPEIVALTTPVVRQVQIREIFLRWSKLERQAGRELPGEVAVRFGFKVKSSLDRDAKDLNVDTIFTADATDTKTESPVFRAEADFAVAYQLKSLDGIGDDNVKAFGRMNGVFNTWPYWREFVQSGVARMGLPNVTLPVLTAPMLVKMYAEEDAKEAAKEEAAASLEEVKADSD